MEAEWKRLLDLALVGDEKAREEVLYARGDSSREEIQLLSSALLEEWDLSDTNPVFAEPRWVWMPQIDNPSLFGNADVSGGVRVMGVVTPAGRLEQLELKRSSGSPAVDQAVLEVAEIALCRPARSDSRTYVETRGGITLHVVLN